MSPATWAVSTGVRAEESATGPASRLVPGARVAGGGFVAAGRWVIVTSESTTGAGAYAGLPAALHVTYATLTRARSGWIVETWQPQN